MSDEDKTRIAELEAEVACLREELAANAGLKEEMEQFAYVASHDLKEPLRIVANYLGLLKRRCGTDLDERAQSYIGMAQGATVRMRQLIDNLLEFSKAQGLDASVQPLAPAAEIAVKNLGQLIEDQAAQVNIGDLPSADIDTVQISRLFQNLIANAIKYRGPNPPVIDIDARRDGDVWQIRVQDNGMGIAPEHQQKVFQMFTRLHGRDQIEGSGIGLATCRRIVERHGGQIGLSSTPGEGSCFWFSLPAISA